MVLEIIGHQHSDTYIDSQYTNYTVNYFVVEEYIYSRESHFPQSDCDSIE